MKKVRTDKCPYPHAMNRKYAKILTICLIAITLGITTGLSANSLRHPVPPATTSAAPNDTVDTVATRQYISKLLILGDSMTGWMAERLNQYGRENDFEVATIVWDGSTISKWASSPKLPKLIEEIDPDAVIVSLGMNELFERRPETKLKQPVDKLLKSFGNRPFVWVGPPSWPGHDEGKTFDAWLEEEVGEGNYFRSFDIDIPRQSKSNPHPSRAGIEKWVDMIAEWIPQNSGIALPQMQKPEPGKLSRGKTFIYKRMRETL